MDAAAQRSDLAGGVAFYAHSDNRRTTQSVLRVTSRTGLNSDAMADQASPGKSGLDHSTILAFARTRAAYERTMMAWIRTATSLITFGFSVYKFFQIEAPPGAERNRLIGPRQFGLLLVSIGLVSLFLAMLEYRQNVRALGAQYQHTQRSLAVLVAGLISLLGIVAILLMIFRQ
jgi:putative membrane protein